MVNSSKKVLFVALSGIGNLLMQSPTIAAFKTARPDWHVTVWVAPRGTAALARSLSYIDEVLEAPIKTSLSQHLRFIRKLRQEKFQTGIVLSPGQLIKSAAYLWLAGIPQRIGHAYPWGQNSPSHLFLTHWVDELPQTHDVSQNLDLLPLAGIALPATTTYTFTPPATAQDQARALLESWQLTNHPYLVGFHAGSATGFEWKRWPLESFVSLGQELIQKKQAHILLFGGPAEKALTAELQAKLGANTTVVDTDLLTVSALMKVCQLFISNDSGLMHLAAAVGVPTIGLFGPTDEVLTGPRGVHSWALRAPGTQAVYLTEKGAANLKTTQTPASLQALTPTSVFSQIQLHIDGQSDS